MKNISIEMSPDRDEEFRRQMQSIELLLAGIERFANAADRDLARQVISTVLAVHCSGIERILEHIASIGEPGNQVIQSMADGDSVVSSLLLLHGLHPKSLANRVEEAMKALPCPAELLSADGGVIRIRANGDIKLKQSIEQAILEKAPDAQGVEISGLMETGFVPVEALLKKSAKPASA